MNKVIQEKPNRYTAVKKWEYKEHLHCMGCTKMMVFECLDSEVDYGGGNLHKCLDCGFAFYGYVYQPNQSDELLNLLKSKAFDK